MASRQLLPVNGGRRRSRLLPGLTSVGRVGDLEIFDPNKGLLCSKSALGRGDCELVGPATVRIVDGGNVYGFRASGKEPTLRRYGPEGATCARHEPELRGDGHGG